jgi:hypothetical protein
MLGAELNEFLGGGAHVEVSVVDGRNEQRGDTRATTAER